MVQIKVSKTAQDKLKEIKIGDTITRLLGGSIRLPVKVTEIDEKFIYGCPPELDWDKETGWKFLITTGAEVDEDLDWDGITKTGSFIDTTELNKD